MEASWPSWSCHHLWQQQTIQERYTSLQAYACTVHVHVHAHTIIRVYTLTLYTLYMCMYMYYNYSMMEICMCMLMYLCACYMYMSVVLVDNHLCYTWTSLIAERLSMRQLNRTPIPSCVYILYIYVCNASGMQLSIPICIVYGVIRSLYQDTVRSRT